MVLLLHWETFPTVHPRAEISAKTFYNIAIILCVHRCPGCIIWLQSRQTHTYIKTVCVMCQWVKQWWTSWTCGFLPSHNDISWKSHHINWLDIFLSSTMWLNEALGLFPAHVSKVALQKLCIAMSTVFYSPFIFAFGSCIDSLGQYYKGV